MRKGIYIPLLLLLGACSVTEDPAEPDSTGAGAELEVHPSSISLGVSLNAATASGANTPRELANADSTQLVQSVTIYLFRSDTMQGEYRWYKPIISNLEKDCVELSSFEKVEAWESHNADESHPYWCRDWEIADGWYKVMAIGRDDRFASSPDAMSPWMDIPQNVWGEAIRLEDAYISLCANYDKVSEPLRASELFVGISEAVPGQRENVECDVVMSRVVAGVVMHVSSIPQTIDGSIVKAVGIVASAATPGVLLESKTPYGTQTSLSDYVTTCLMKEAIPATATVDSATGLYRNVNTAYPELHDDIIAKGAFITPQASTTLYVVAWDSNGTPIKRWPVNMLTDDAQLSSYSLLANHYYEIDVSLHDLTSGNVTSLGSYYGHANVPL